jgi:hypothetical protein
MNLPQPRLNLKQLNGTPFLAKHTRINCAKCHNQRTSQGQNFLTRAGYGADTSNAASSAFNLATCQSDRLPRRMNLPQPRLNLRQLDGIPFLATHTRRTSQGQNFLTRAGYGANTSNAASAALEFSHLPM